MMTSSTNSIYVALNPHQVSSQTQSKANGKAAAQQPQDEEPSPSRVASNKASVGYSRMDLKKFHTQQAADVGLLRPLLMEMMDMEPDTPRTRDLIRQFEKVESESAARTVDVFAE